MTSYKKNILLFFFWVAFTGFAQAETLTPLATIEQLLANIQSMETGDTLTPEQIEKNSRLSEQAIKLLDVDHVSQKTLGKHWKKRTAEEKEKFIDLLGHLFQKIAFPNSARFFSGLKIEYGEVVIEREHAVVPLVVLYKSEGEIGIDFKLRKRDNAWRVYDVILDEVSMRNNLRTQFHKVITQTDYKGLVARMNKKLNDEK